MGKSGAREIRCQFIILARKDELTPDLRSSIEPAGRPFPTRQGEIRCQYIILGEIRCQFIILARKDELTPDLRKDELTPDLSPERRTDTGFTKRRTDTGFIPPDLSAKRRTDTGFTKRRTDTGFIPDLSAQVPREWLKKHGVVGSVDVEFCHFFLVGVNTEGKFKRGFCIPIKTRSHEIGIALNSEPSEGKGISGYVSLKPKQELVAVVVDDEGNVSREVSWSCREGHTAITLSVSLAESKTPLPSSSLRQLLDQERLRVWNTLGPQTSSNNLDWTPGTSFHGLLDQDQPRFFWNPDQTRFWNPLGSRTSSNNLDWPPGTSFRRSLDQEQLLFLNRIRTERRPTTWFGPQRRASAGRGRATGDFVPS